MTVSLLDVLVSGRPDRSPLEMVRRGTTGGLAATVVLAYLAGRRSGRRR